MVNVPVYKNIDISNLYVPLLIVSTNGYIVDSNDKACEILGLNKIPENLLLDFMTNTSYFVAFFKAIVENRDSNQIYFPFFSLNEKSPETLKNIYFTCSYIKDDFCLAEIKRIDINNEIEINYPHRIRNEKALNKSLSVLMKLEKDSINKALQYILDVSDASILYIFKNFTEDKTEDLCARYSEEVCAPGVVSEINNPKHQYFKYKDGLLNFQRKLSEGEIITGYLNNFPLNESEFITPKNTGYLIIAPIFIDNEWFGYVGMNFCCNNKDISALDIKVIATLSNQLSSYYSLSIKRQILRDANDELTEDLVLKDKMTSIMGKDVKHSLDEIIELSNSLLFNIKNNLQGKIIEYSRLINNSAKTVNAVLEYLSELIEVIYSNKNYDLKPISAKGIISESISSYKELSSQRSLILLDKSKKDFILYTDEHIVLSIFKSILINAIKYSNQGTIITMSCKRDSEIKGNVLLCIENFGIGLAKEIVDKMYKPVYNSSKDIDRDVTTRLGMQVSKRIINLIKGDIKVKSILGKGTSVYISIPEVNITDKIEETKKIKSEDLTVGQLTDRDNVFDKSQNNSLPESVNIKNINIPLLIVNSDGFIIEKNDKAYEILGLEDISDDFLLKRSDTRNVTIAIMKSVVEDKASNRFFLPRCLRECSLKKFENIYFVSSFLEKNLCLVEIKKVNINNVIELECLRRIVYEDALNKSASILSEQNKDSPHLAMKYLLDAFKSSYIYVYKNFTDKNGDLIAKREEEVFAPGISNKDYKSQGVAYKDGFMRVQQELSAGRIISGYIKNFSQAEINHLAPLEIGYLLIVPVFVNSEWYGFVSLGYNYKNIKISALDIQSLQSVSEQFAIYYSFLKYNQSLKYAKDRLIKNLEFKNKMISLMRHDIKNPLSGIIGFSDLLIEDIKENSKGKIMEYSTLINKTAISLDGIVDNISYWVKSVNPNVKPYIRPIAVKKIVEKSISLTKVIALYKSVNLLNKVNCNCVVNTDVDMIFTVIRNILINAIKFTPEKGTVTIFSEKDPKINGNIIICVEDTGVGMLQERINHILKETEIVSEEGTNGEKGLGLGLQFSKIFINLVKGEMRIESTLNKGTKFLISLPKYKRT